MEPFSRRDVQHRLKIVPHRVFRVPTSRQRNPAKGQKPFTMIRAGLIYFAENSSNCHHHGEFSHHLSAQLKSSRDCRDANWRTASSANLRTLSRFRKHTCFLVYKQPRVLCGEDAECQRGCHEKILTS